jgi:hypothetical protein
LKVCPQRPVDKVFEVVQPIQAPKGQIFCPHCRGAIIAAEYRSHLSYSCTAISEQIKEKYRERHSLGEVKFKPAKFVHPAKIKSKKKKGKPQGLKPKSNPNSFLKCNRSTVYFGSMENSLDLSKGFHQRRENGRFGSFPLSDDYGEDSML